MTGGLEESELLDDDCVTIIEWGDLVASELPRSYLVVRIHMGDPISPDDRVLRFESVGEVWSDRLEQIKDLSSAAAVRSC